MEQKIETNKTINRLNGPDANDPCCEELTTPSTFGE